MTRQWPCLVAGTLPVYPATDYLSEKPLPAMLFVLASILSSIIILVLFRLIDRSAAVTRHTIVVSYLVSAITGVVFFPIQWQDFPLYWAAYAVFGGVALYVGFSLIGLTTQRNGIAVAGVATKISVVIPIGIGILFLGESVNWLKLLGIFAGLSAVALVAVKPATKQAAIKPDNAVVGASSMVSWNLPVLVFVFSGLTDASFKLLQVAGLTTVSFLPFLVMAFGFAFVTSLIHHLVGKERSMNRQSLFYGVFLGVTNFGTVYFIMKALAIPNWESSLIYPLNHFGVVLGSVLVGVLLFGESLPRRVQLGLVMAIISIVFLALAST